MKESAHQGKPEERSRRLGDNGVIGTGKDVIMTGELPFNTRQPKIYPSSFLTELSRFDNSQNVKMRAIQALLRRSPLFPAS